MKKSSRVGATTRPIIIKRIKEIYRYVAGKKIVFPFHHSREEGG